MNEALTKTGRNFIIKSCKKTSLHGALTKSSESPGYYVIEFTDGVKNGFSLTSADRRLSEVLENYGLEKRRGCCYKCPLQLGVFKLWRWMV